MAISDGTKALSIARLGHPAGRMEVSMVPADCAMCPHETCSLAESCRRSQRSGTVPNEWQVWSYHGPKDTTECSGWWPVPQIEGERR